MNRRAFLLGAVAAPMVGPALAQTPAPVAKAAGGLVHAGSQLFVVERGAEMVIPTSLYDAVMRQIRSDHIAIVDGGTFTGEIIWTVPRGAFPR